MLLKILIVMLLATISLLMIPQFGVSSKLPVVSGDLTIPAVTTKVLLGDNGTVYMLWIVHSLLTGFQPGIWYAKYEPNGTAANAPTLLRNSSTIQSADMAEDLYGNLDVVWAEGPAFENATTNLLTTNSDAQLYYAEVNSTNSQLTPTPLTGYGKIVVSPSIALDNASIPHVVWTEETISAQNRTLSEYYGTIENGHLIGALLLTQYGNQPFMDVPRPQIVFDQTYSRFHIAWTYTQQQNTHVDSQVRYAMVDSASNETRRVTVADLKEPVQDASITLGGNGSAYVIWQIPSGTSPSLYVSKISSGGRVLFLHSFAAPLTTTSPYLTAASDAEENLYLVWYQPPQLPQRVVPARSSTRISYMRIDEAGSVTDSGNGLIAGTVLAIGVSNAGVYAVSSSGIIELKARVPTLLIQLMVGLAAFSTMGIVLTDEGKYRLMRSITSLSKSSKSPEVTPNANAILQLLTHRPGCDLKEIRRSLRTSATSVSLTDLTRLETAGYVSSVRVGLGRRFFDSNPIDQMAVTNRIASMILNEIKRTPGTWEGKIAHDLCLSQQIVHYHVKRMRTRGLLDVELRGRRKLYRLANSRVGS